MFSYTAAAPTEPLSDTLFCEEPVQVGNCSSFKVRWHYSKNQRQCLPFVYSGCQGNPNNFVSEEKCEAVCIKKGWKILTLNLIVIEDTTKIFGLHLCNFI